MQRSFRLAVAAVAALAAGAVVATLPPAALAKDDAAERKEKRDAYKKKLKEEKKLPYHDLSYFVDVGTAKETRWTQTDPPPFDDLSEKKGGQFFATFALKEGSPPVVRVTIQKFLAKDGNTSYSLPFEYAGYSADCGDKKKMITGFYEDWIKKNTEPLKDKCDEPKKAAAAGPADLFATAVATDKESKKRERRDWYAWLGEGATWIAQFSYPDYEMVEKGKLNERVAEFMKYTKEAKPPK